MSAAERQLLAARRARDVARTAYAARLAQVKADLAARGVGSRLAHTIGDEVAEAVEIGREVAREHKGVLAGTIAAVLLWLVKEPLVAAALALGAAGDDDDDVEILKEHDDERVPEQV
jgi:hypothetical protein